MSTNDVETRSADLLAGLIFILASIIAWISLSNIPFGMPARIGPGFFPKITIGIIAAIGAFLVARNMPAIRTVSLGGVSLRVPALILAAPAAFALTVNQFGLVLAVMLMTFIAAAASSDTRWKMVAVLAPLLALLASLIFVAGLGMMIPLWPR